MTQIDELLRETANAVERDDEVDRRAIDRAHRALFAAIVAAAAQEPLPAPRRRAVRSRVPVTAGRLRSRRLALAGGIAAASLAVAGVLGFQGGFTPSPALAATMDRLAHLVAGQDWSGMPGPGQYLYTKSEGVVLAGDGTHALDQRQTWFPSGGHMLVSDPRDAGNSATSPNDEVESIGGPSSYFPITVSGWQSLSTDPATLLQQIKNLDAPNGPDTPAEEFTAVGDALSETPIPPAVRVVLYRAVALIPGVQLMGPQIDPAGQPGLGVGYYADGKLQSELIFDQQTARLLGVLGYDEDGNLTHAWSYVEQEIVDSAPSVGNTPPATQYPQFRVATVQGGSATTEPTPTQQQTTTTAAASTTTAASG
jgi:hypothetical protein